VTMMLITRMIVTMMIRMMIRMVDDNMIVIR
jgi:hypothetical protein